MAVPSRYLRGTFAVPSRYLRGTFIWLYEDVPFVPPSSALKRSGWLEAADGPYEYTSALERFADQAAIHAGSPHRRLLDLRCGIGGTMRHFASCGWEVFGTDCCDDLLRAAQVNAPEMGTFVTASTIEALLESQSTFELIVAFDDSAQQLSQPDLLYATLQLAFSRLSIGGHFAFQFARSGQFDTMDVLNAVRGHGFHGAWTASPVDPDTPWIHTHSGTRDLFVARRDS